MLLILYLRYRNVMEISSLRKDRIRRVEEKEPDGTKYLFIGGWRKGKENGWGQKRSSREVKNVYSDCLIILYL